MLDEHSVIQSIVTGLKNQTFSDPEDREWGIGVEFEKDILKLTSFLDKKWVKKVARVNDTKGPECANSQLRIQYIEGKFYIYLACYFPKYDDKHKPKKLTELQLIKILEWIISSNYIIYDCSGNNIFPIYN